MAKPNPFTVDIDRSVGSGGEEGTAIHQTNPTWVLTFVRFNVQDPLRTAKSSGLEIRGPIVVENDCIQCSVTSNKGSLTPSMSATLVQTDINYETAIHPGDFVFVNMLNWEKYARALALDAQAGKPINGVDQGFKGIFKVQSVRKTLSTEPITGVKSVVFKVDGYAFTEFNNTIYFNPNLINKRALDKVALYIADIAPAWAAFVTKNGKPPLQDILAFLIQALVGKGINKKARIASGLVVSPNEHFQVPSQVGKYLGIVENNDPKSKSYRSVQSAAEIYNYLFGIQKYNGPAGFVELKDGLNPSNLKPLEEFPNFFYTSEPCDGNTLLKTEYWNQVKVWAILNQYTNSPLNELYTCFKVNKANRVMPTVVFRQIPFTSEDFTSHKYGAVDDQANNIHVTKFLTLPRWKITASEVFSVDVGRDEAARINFVQYYAKSNFTQSGMEIAGETAIGNYVFDAEDIKRSGLRPYVIQTQFYDLPSVLVHRAPQWARIVGDALIGGHIKLNGTITCIGIVEPITVGDNLEYDNAVYHIEQITHSCAVNAENGQKQFRTVISVSHGVSIESSEKGTVYSEMTFSNAYASRDDDFKLNGSLPGISESQDVSGRKTNIDLDHKADAAFTNKPFPQPRPKKK